MGGNIYIRGGAGANNAVGFTTFSNKIEVQSSSNTAATSEKIIINLNSAVG